MQAVLRGHHVRRVGCQKIERKPTDLGTAYLCKRAINFVFEQTKNMIDTGLAGCRQDDKRQKATRALHCMAFARLSPRPSRDSVSGRIVCGWRCLSRV
jgi:hypothetical protein